jgi:hypothetical protein
MNAPLTRCIWPLALGAMDKLVLLALADGADAQGTCSVCLDALSAKASVCKRTAQQALRSLCHGGWVVIEPRAKQASCYHIQVQRFNPSMGAASAPLMGAPDAPETVSWVQQMHPSLRNLRTLKSSSDPLKTLKRRGRERESAHARPMGACRAPIMGAADAPINGVEVPRGMSAEQVYSSLLEDWRRDVPEANADAFGRWIVYRETQGKPMHAQQRLFQARQLAQQGGVDIQAEVVEWCIGQGYATLIPIGDIRRRKEGFVQSAAQKAARKPWRAHE